MNAISKKVGVSLALSSLLALGLGSVALATHPRPGGGTPLRVPLVAAFNKCGGPATADDPAPTTPPPGQSHVPPHMFPSCPPNLKSSNLTLQSTGQGQGRVRFDLICELPSNGPPPCLDQAGDQENFRILFAEHSDVRCQGANANGTCTGAGAPYTGQLIVESVIRITDHSSGNPSGTTCTNGAGVAPCLTATVSDIPFQFPTAACTAAPAGNCKVLAGTTFDSLIPGMIKEFQRASIEVLNVRVFDSGPDGEIAPAGFMCPTTCGTGDERKFLAQGIFAP